jgi:hypothetical protein
MYSASPLTVLPIPPNNNNQQKIWSEIQIF